MIVPDGQPERADAELIDRWRAGDETAAAELVRRHARAVARFLGAAGAGDEVDDLVQEAFFRAFRGLDRFRGGASFRTWVMTIASNALTDFRRRRGRRPVLPLEGRDVTDGAADPHGALVARETEARVRDEVARLPPMQRDVFLMRAQQGLPYEEIAAALGTSVGAARVHYHQAVKRLRRALEG
ncbi:MAG TPA: sigma-70 family RNA polymerase sigma factor [Gemmatimonadales bacterium]|nr:sigma-70 family RNA polymerase sigma factor [Gemmatimonadales bacterium]